MARRISPRRNATRARRSRCWRRACPPFTCATPPPTAGTGSRRTSWPIRGRRRPAARPFLPLVGTRRRLPAVRAARAAPEQPRRRQHGMGGRLQGRADAVRRADGYALALACSAPWLARSVGFVGFSDGWQQLRADGRLPQSYERAENGNVAMTGEIDLRRPSEFVLALGFGGTPAGRAARAGQSAQGFDRREVRVPRRLAALARSRTTCRGADPLRSRWSISAPRCCASTSRSISAAA